MHSQPTPAHPSYRLISTLRMLHCADGEAGPEASALETAFERWRMVLYGQEEQLSAVHEVAWRSTLSKICKMIVRRAQDALESLGRVRREVHLEAPWAGGMQNNIELLWREELEVAGAVAESVKAGNEF